jgi:predicted TIM-barrel fold metal-dependent hydrolase
MTQAAEGRRIEMDTIGRRSFLAGGAAALLPLHARPAEPSQIIDTHVHFYDPTRPQGVPWPPKNQKLLYRPVLPEELERIVKPLGVTGVIEVEASPLVEDNQWVLDLAKKNPIIIGAVGHLEPESPDFAKQLDRFHRNPRFRGIRCGNLWNKNLSARVADAKFIDGLKLLAEAGLEMDSANPNAALLTAIVRLTDKIHNLRVVIDHLPIDTPVDASERTELETAYRELAKRPQVYIKVSAVPRRVNGRVIEETSYYRPSLDRLWELFGSDRLIYGSNWPVSDLIAPYEVAFKIVKEYFASKGQEATEKYFWSNAVKAYGLEAGLKSRAG